MLHHYNGDDDTYTAMYSDDGSYTSYTTVSTFTTFKTTRTYEFDSGMSLVETFMNGVNDIDSTFFACGDNDAKSTSITDNQKENGKKGSNTRNKGAVADGVDSQVKGPSYLFGCFDVGCGLTCGNEEDTRDDIVEPVIEPDTTMKTVKRRFGIGEKSFKTSKSKTSTTQKDASFASNTATTPSHESNVNSDKTKTRQRPPRFRRAFAKMIKTKSKVSKATNSPQVENKYSAEAQAAAAMKGKTAAEDTNNGRENLKSTYERARRRRRRASKQAPFHRTKALVLEAANKFAEDHAEFAERATEKLAEEQVKAALFVSEGIETAIRTTAVMAEAAEYDVAKVAARALADVASTIGQPILRTLSPSDKLRRQKEISSSEKLPPSSNPCAITDADTDADTGTGTDKNDGTITDSSDDFKATLANEMLLSGYRLENEHMYQTISKEMFDLAARLEDADVEQGASESRPDGDEEKIVGVEVEVLVEPEVEESTDTNIELVICFTKETLLSKSNDEVPSLDISSAQTEPCTDESTVQSESFSSTSSSNSQMTQQRSNTVLDETSSQRVCNETLGVDEIGASSISDNEDILAGILCPNEAPSDIEFKSSYHSF